MNDSALSWARNGAAAELASNGTVLGRIYEVHPETVSRFGLKQAVFMAEIALPALLETTTEITGNRELPKFPATSRDVTLILGRAIPAAEVVARVETRKADILEAVFVKDLYEGASTPEGKKSLTLRMVYRSATQTLADKKVNKAQDKLVADLTKTFDATLPA